MAIPDLENGLTGLAGRNDFGVGVNQSVPERQGSSKKVQLQPPIFGSAGFLLYRDGRVAKLREVVRAGAHIQLPNLQGKKKRIGDQRAGYPGVTFHRPSIDVHVGVKASRLLQLVDGPRRGLVAIQRSSIRCEEPEGVVVGAHQRARLYDPLERIRGYPQTCCLMSDLRAAVHHGPLMESVASQKGRPGLGLLKQLKHPPGGRLAGRRKAVDMNRTIGSRLTEVLPTPKLFGAVFEFDSQTRTPLHEKGRAKPVVLKKKIDNGVLLAGTLSVQVRTDNGQKAFLVTHHVLSPVQLRLEGNGVRVDLSGILVDRGFWSA